jgi:DeoR/GlpR family transcriptional regulator of sugar metabolism
MRISKERIAERQQKILDLLDTTEFLSMTDVANSLGIAVSSARRQIRKMEMAGQVMRTYRGIIRSNNGYEEHLTEKYRIRKAEKRAIAAAARKFIEDGDVILISGGSTTYELSRLLREAKNLHVITTSIPIAFDLYLNPNIRLEVVGGVVDRLNGVVISTQALNYLTSIHVKKAFLGADSISIEHGITTPSYFEAEIEKLVFKNTKSVYILADYSKFNKVTLTQVASLDQVHCIITDSTTNQGYLKKIEALGPQIVRAGL